MHEVVPSFVLCAFLDIALVFLEFAINGTLIAKKGGDALLFDTIGFCESLVESLQFSFCGNGGADTVVEHQEEDAQHGKYGVEAGIKDAYALVMLLLQEELLLFDDG